eukprot:Awhi_evm1s12066
MDLTGNTYFGEFDYQEKSKSLIITEEEEQSAAVALKLSPKTPRKPIPLPLNPIKVSPTHSQ